MVSREVTVIPPERTAPAVIDAGLAIRQLETRFALAVRQRDLLSEYIKTRLHADKHFYNMGGENQKPSLNKEGAEIICLAHALKPRYAILYGPEAPPEKDAPYQITVKCSLYRDDNHEGEGIGSASSYITKKNGDFIPRQKDPGLRYNATLKMAQKSAYIAATLNSTAASEFFTQDIEDDQSGGQTVEDTGGTQYFCAEHKTAWFKRGQMRGYAHPIGDTGKWCQMPADKPATHAPQVNTTTGEIKDGPPTAADEAEGTRMMNEPPAHTEAPTKAETMVSAAQLRLIDQLATGERATEAMQFIAGLGKSQYVQLTVKEASGLITALKAVRE